MANAIRALAMDAVEKAKSGHPGMPMGMADVATVLFRRFLKFDPARPDWPDRDRFVLSAGHGSMLLYALAYLTGYEAMTLEEIKRFRQLGSLTPGHPEVDVAIGVETTTGPLGQGFGNAVGFALAERVMNARFGDDLVDHRTFVIASDGDLMEGVSHEAASLAGHLQLDRLVVLYDDNGISIDGPTDLAFSDDTTGRFAAYGWHVDDVDGHDADAVAAAIEKALTAGRPALIRCRTTIGFGAPSKAGTAGSHGSPLGDEEIEGARAALDWPHPAFEVPEDISAAWRETGKRGRPEREAWEARHKNHPNRAEFDDAVAGTLPAELPGLVVQYKTEMAAEAPKIATRVASGQMLERLVPAIPSLIGGSADLTPSNNSKVKNFEDIAAGRFGGRYIRFGVREHAMAAAMNGMALHGGLVPYGATFLTFTDYCRPSIRLAALMGQRVVYVMTHDSIGLGEDGPTHQPVEHLAALRAIPNLRVFRPADPVEVAECWQLALERTDGPSLIALSRQGTPTVRRMEAADNLCARGGYVLAESDGTPAAVLMGSGTEVAIALDAQATLAKEGVEARVVSMPSLDLFASQDESYRQAVLGPDGTPRVAIEAGVAQGWHSVLGAKGRFVGMTGFGASAPAGALYEHFEITADAVLSAVRDLVL
jgi:transketolase